MFTSTLPTPYLGAFLGRSPKLDPLRRQANKSSNGSYWALEAPLSKTDPVFRNECEEVARWLERLRSHIQTPILGPRLLRAAFHILDMKVPHSHGMLRLSKR